MKNLYIPFYLFAIFTLFCVEPVFAESVSTQVVIVGVPNAPSDLTAVPTAPTQVQLSWSDNSEGGDDGFIVERKTSPGGTYAEIATTGPDVATYIDNTVQPSTTYFYEVAAFEGSVLSPYSNEATVTTASNGGGGGGGNGGGGGGGGGGGAPYIPPPAVIPTNVSISGVAYPLGEVFVLEDGQFVVKTVAGPDAKFTANIGNLTGGNYVFSVYGQDSAGRRSTVFSFPVAVIGGATTMISGIFLSPTIDTDKSEVKKGDTIEIFGESMPNSTISIQVDSPRALFFQTSSTANGAYLYHLDTSVLQLGQYSAKSNAVASSAISQDSFSQAFTVDNQNILQNKQNSGCPPNYPIGDLNQDCHVDLVDFSILAYWYQRSGFPPAYDLNHDGSIDLTDFSIMAYYWTG